MDIEEFEKNTSQKELNIELLRVNEKLSAHISELTERIFHTENTLLLLIEIIDKKQNNE